MKLQFELCRDNAQLPVKATTGSACFDIFAANDAPININVVDPAPIPTGLKPIIPEGYALMIYSRSGYGFSHGVRLVNCVGVIDSDYHEEIMVKLRQDGMFTPDYVVNPGDRIAQAMLIPLTEVEIEQVAAVDPNDRGGFGSTGV